MSNKELQRKRMEGYFIEAAKKLSYTCQRHELSVRRIAEEAGYSYATLYNYFRNADHLLWYLIINIFDDISGLLENIMISSLNGKGKLYEAAKSYVDYFFDNPNAFSLLFVSPPGTPPEDVMNKLNNHSLKGIILKIINEITDEPEESERVGSLLTASLHGHLLFALSLNQHTKEDLHTLIENDIDLLIKKG